MFITSAAALHGGGDFPAMRSGDFTYLYVFGFALVFGVIGFLDDFVKVKYHAQPWPNGPAEAGASAGGGGLLSARCSAGAGT